MGKIGEGAIEKRALAFFSVVAINSNLSTTGAKVITLMKFPRRFRVKISCVFKDCLLLFKNMEIISHSGNRMVQ